MQVTKHHCYFKTYFNLQLTNEEIPVSFKIKEDRSILYKGDISITSDSTVDPHGGTSGCRLTSLKPYVYVEFAIIFIKNKNCLLDYILVTV